MTSKILSSGTELFLVLRLRAISAVWLLALLVSACGGDQSKDPIASARSQIEAKDYAAAILQLKSVLQSNPQAPEARFLLGEALFSSGDVGQSVVEYQKARDLNYDKRLVVPALLKALLADGQAKRVIELVAATTFDDPKSRAEADAALGGAYILLGDIGRGGAAIDAALRQDPENIDAQILNARLIAGRGATDEAIAVLDRLLERRPKTLEALRLKGEMLWHGRGAVQDAVTVLRQAISLDGKFVAAHASLIRLLIQQRDFAGAKQQLDGLRVVAPNHPETQFFIVQLALHSGDLKSARDGAQRLLLFDPDNPYILQLAGFVEHEIGALVHAESHLAKALNRAPDLDLARRTLVSTYLRSGQSSKALATIQPLLEKPKPSAEVLSFAGEAQLQAGNYSKAEYYYGLAAKAKPDDVRISTALALSQLNQGRYSSSIARLDELAASDRGTFADLALISERMRRNDREGALKAVARLQEKLPGKPMAPFLHGQIVGAGGDLVAAKVSFEKALAADPAYFPAVSALSAIDLAEKSPTNAIRRYEKLLVGDPKNFRAMLAVAEIRRANGAKQEEVLDLLKKAVSLNPGEAVPRVALIDYLLSQRRYEAALTAAQEAGGVFPDELMVQDSLGRAQIAAGSIQQAVSTFKKLAATHPRLIEPQLRLAEAFVVSKNYASAKQTLRNALELSPKNLAAQRSLIQVALVEGKPDEALRIARMVQSERPTEPIGHLMEGEIQAGRRAWDPALAAFRAALARQETTELAKKLNALFVVANRPAESQRFAEQWMRSHPRDADFVYHLGLMAMGNKDYAAAELRFKEVLAIEPENAGAMNNLAWLMVKRGVPGALEMAERANRLMPNHSAVLDTLAAALSAENRLSEAIEAQVRAVANAPGMPSYRLNLAKLLVRSGDKTRAKAELQVLQGLGSAFAGQNEVQELLKSL